MKIESYQNKGVRLRKENKDEKAAIERVHKSLNTIYLRELTVLNKDTT